MARTQISAVVSDETRERLERFVQANGMKKAAVIERALLHHLQALEELPADIIIPPRLLLSPEAFQRVLDRLEAPGEPTPAMRALFGHDEAPEQ